MLYYIVMNIINNEAVDFIFALRRFGIRNKQINVDYPSMIEIENWCKEYETKLSPFLLNDISLLVDKTILITLYLMNKIHETPNIQSAEDLLNFLKKITATTFKEEVISKFIHYETSDLSVDKIYDIIFNDGLHPGYDLREEAEIIYGVLLEPEGFLNRLEVTYSQFYKLVYAPSKKTFEKIENEKFLWHEKRFFDNPKSYLKNLGLNSFLKKYPNTESCTFYFSLFADNDLFSLWDSKTIVIGGATDSRIIQQSAKTKSDLFFSCLGDAKRLEIMRLTAQRPWYSTELATYFNLKPATLSYHLNKLVEADLLNMTNGEAKRFYYTLNRDAISSYLNFVSQDLLGLNKE